MYKILIVEDDSVIAGAVKRGLESWNYTVKCVDNFQHVKEEFIAFEPQLVLMDISLPFFNGYHWCAELRRISDIPIIFLSSASDNMNIVMAMNMGADDFIAKPFDMSVLTAKIQAMIRRAYDFSGQTHLIECGGAVFNTSDGTISYNEKRVELTKNEHKILQILMENKGRIVSRETIMAKLWESDSFVDDNTLTVNVNRLRKKLETIGQGELIHTKKGVGYLVE